MASNSITSSTCNGERSGREGSVLSLFLMTCETSSACTLVNRLTTSKLRRPSPFWRLISCIYFVWCFEFFTKEFVLPIRGFRVLLRNSARA
jgi:hypothetical protein